MELWTKLHASFREHYKIKLVAKDVGLPPVYIAGHLAYLWTWALTSAPNGNIDNCEPEEIESIIDWQGEAGVLYDAFIKRKLIDKNKESIEIHDFKKHYTAAQNHTKKTKLRKAEPNGTKRNQLEPNGTNDTKMEPRIDKNRSDQNRIDKKKEDNIYSPESGDSEPPPGTFFQIPLKDKTFYCLFRKDIEYYAKAYPDKMIDNEIRKLIAWNEANPRKQKTKSGIRRHINSWLSNKNDQSKPVYKSAQDIRHEEAIKNFHELNEQYEREANEQSSDQTITDSSRIIDI